VKPQVSKSTRVSSPEYTQWLSKLKQDFSRRQLKAAVQVNSHLIAFYWQLGQEIVAKEKESSWGQGFLPQLSRDLCNEFPNVKGFSLNNLQYIKRWTLFYTLDTAHSEVASNINSNSGTACSTIELLAQVPWGHNLKIISKCNSQAEAFYYISNTLQHGWSRAVLVHQIESGLWQREGKAVSNFKQTLPSTQSDLAQQTLKDPYMFDFLDLTSAHNERELEQELEQSLVAHITQFLLELGAGFAYVGKQVALQVGTRDFYLDLLFYHTRLHCYVVIELKTTDFEPEHAGKLNFYITAVDEQLKSESDNATIGILLCKGKDKLVAEYSLRDTAALSDKERPIGVSEYQLTQALPDELKSSLPSVEEIEGELAKDFGGEL